MIGSLLSAGVLVWLLWDEPVERRHLSLWLMAVFVTYGIRLVEWRAYCADPQRQVRGAYWARWFTAGAAVTGLIWGYMGWSFFQPTLLFLFPMALVLAGQVALSVPSVGIYWPAHVVFNLLAILPFILRNYLEEGRLFFGQSIALTVLMVACLVFARRQQATIIESIRLRFANVDLLDRLTQENHRAEQARQTAEAANAAKSRFLAAASHDLRQPLQAMFLFTHTLLESAQAGQRIDPALAGKLRSSCEGLEMLLDSLLDLSQVEAGALKVELGNTRLQPIFERIRHEFADQAAAKGLHLRLVPTVHHVLSDAPLLERMVRNLVVNALRYTEQGGILIGCRRHGDKLRIEVRDSGIGIAPEAMVRIFSAFYQVANPERDRQKGLGLGLSIVDALASQLGHRINVRSRPGKGSVFAIELSPAPQNIIGYGEAVPVNDVLRGKLVVVMDDEAQVRDAMAALLQHWGCFVVQGENAEESFAAMAAAGLTMVPSVILVDWRLREGREGYQEAKHLESHFGQAIPTLIITGDTEPEAFEQQELPVMRKPVQGFRLRAQLDYLLRTPSTEEHQADRL